MAGDEEMTNADDEEEPDALDRAAQPATGAHIQYGEAQKPAGDYGLAAGVARGNIASRDEKAEVMGYTESSRVAREHHEAIMQDLELRRREKSTVVPTADGDVRRVLRQMGEPVTLFGEKEMERRNRLRKMLAGMDEEQRYELLASKETVEVDMADGAAPQLELFYTEGPPELKAARLQIATFSLQRAAQRLARARARRTDPDEDPASEAAAAVAEARTIINQSSELGDERPIQACAFSPDGTELATAAWSGAVKLWRMPACTLRASFKAHDDRITGLAWRPQAGPGRPLEAFALATAGADGVARLWSGAGRPLVALRGHTARLGRIAVHPMGGHVATASFDGTWRLWDAATGQCLAEQEGHARAVFTVAFHPDGSLAASGGLDAIGRVWDLRSGRSVMVLEGHMRGILALDFSSNGTALASGSEDHSARVWDLRKRGAAATLPGHTSLISQVRYEPEDGHWLLTAGYDATAKLWDARSFQLVRTLAGHEGRIMGADIAPGGAGVVATVSYDRTLKLWSPEGL